MDTIKRLIEQAKALMVCPEFGRHYETDEIKFKGFLDHTYILQEACSNNHQPIFTTWITSYAPTEPADRTPLQDDHVLALHEALQHFSGNFRALWPKER